MEWWQAIITVFITFLTGLFGWLKTKDAGRFKGIDQQIALWRARVEENSERIIHLEASESACLERESLLQEEIAKHEQQLEELRQVIDTVGRIGFVGEITVDDSGIIREWSPAATAIFHWTAREMIGQPLDRVIPPATRYLHHEAFNRCIKEKRQPRMEPLITIATNRQGELIDLRIELSGWGGEGKWFYHAKITMIRNGNGPKSGTHRKHVEA